MVADVSPYAWYPSALSEDMSACCGHKRMEGCYPIKSLIHHGVQIVAGSDWPSASPSLNPWLGFGTMVTRRNPSGEPPFTLAEDQAVTVAEALEIFTIGGAAALDKADESGTLEVGKSADMAVLDRDIFGVDASEIAGTVVEMTVFEGRIVFDGKQ